MKNRAGHTKDFALGRLANLNHAAEGTNLLPPQVGEFRIPFASNFKNNRTQLIDGQTYFTLSWDNVDLDNVSHYIIYVEDATNPNSAPISPSQTPVSPVRIVVNSPTDTRLVFTIQTVMKNGFSSDLSGSPTCTGITL